MPLAIFRPLVELTSLMSEFDKLPLYSSEGMW